MGSSLTCIVFECKSEDAGLIPINHTKKPVIEVQGSVIPVLWGGEWIQVHCCSYPSRVNSSHVQEDPVFKTQCQVWPSHLYEYTGTSTWACINTHKCMYQHSHVCMDTQRDFNSVLWNNFVWLCKEIERRENHHQVTERYLPQLHSTSGH